MSCNQKRLKSRVALELHENRQVAPGLVLKMPLRLSMSRSKATLNARYLRRGVSGGRVTYYVHIYIYIYIHMYVPWI